MAKKMSKLLILEILLFSFVCGCGSGSVAGGKDDVKILAVQNAQPIFF